jgi:hypothetical protein
MTIPDPIEAGEASAERWAAENLMDDNFICGCGALCKINEGVYIHPNPYAPPVCPDCALTAEK